MGFFTQHAAVAVLRHAATMGQWDYMVTQRLAFWSLLINILLSIYGRADADHTNAVKQKIGNAIS